MQLLLHCGRRGNFRKAPPPPPPPQGSTWRSCGGSTAWSLFFAPFFPQAIQATITRTLWACGHFTQAILFVCAHACRGSAGKLVDQDAISKADQNGHTGSHSPSRNHPPTQQSNHSKSQSHSKTPTAHRWVPWQSAASASVPVSLNLTEPNANTE